jgi:hypothetical protein
MGKRCHPVIWLGDLYYTMGILITPKRFLFNHSVYNVIIPAKFLQQSVVLFVHDESILSLQQHISVAAVVIASATHVKIRCLQ